MKKNHAFLAAAMAAALCFSLSSCTAASAVSSGSASSGASSAAAGSASGTAAASASGQSSTASAAALTKVTFVLDWTPNTNHTGLYVALAKGWFEDAGLAVEIVQPPEDGAEMLVGSGKADFGVSFQDSMEPALVGDEALPITAVAAVIQHNTSGIVSRAGEGINTPKGLEGKKYATWDLPVEKAMLQNVMQQDGGDFSKVVMIPSTITDEPSALKSKSVDAIWIFYAWAGIACENAGVPTDFFAFRDINPVFDYYTPVIIANNSFLEAHPETARAFLAALKKGYEYAEAQPEEAAEILMEQNPELRSSADLVTASQKYLAGRYTAEAASWGVIDPARWNAFYNWLNENGLSDPVIPENTGFTNAYLPQN